MSVYETKANLGKRNLYLAGHTALSVHRMNKTDKSFICKPRETVQALSECRTFQEESAKPKDRVKEPRSQGGEGPERKITRVTVIQPQHSTRVAGLDEVMKFHTAG